MNKKEIRWQQRFHNFEKAFLLLQRTVNIESLSEAERGGLIQFFEVAFELSWKTMKDYLEAQGFLVKTPRETIKQAFQMELIPDGQTWLQALEDRNLTTHTYDEETTYPYFFDVVHFDTLQNEDLVNHVNEYGKILFTRHSMQKQSTRSL